MDAIKSTLIYLIISSIFILPFLLWNPKVFLTAAPLGMVQTKLFSKIPHILPQLQISLTLITIFVSMLTFYKTRDLFISIFITYLFYGVFCFSIELFSKIALLLYFSAILTGIKCLKKLKYSNKEPSSIFRKI